MVKGHGRAKRLAAGRAKVVAPTAAKALKAKKPAAPNKAVRKVSRATGKDMEKGFKEITCPQVATTCGQCPCASTRLLAADQGDAGAQSELGDMYFEALGVPQDYGQAASWYRKAANRGHAAAQRNLGDMYIQGQGVTQDYKTAVSWYRKAADQGDDMAQCRLGAMYEEGKGVPKDFAEAV